MVEINEKLDTPRHEAGKRERLELPFELRQKTRQRVRLASGEEVAMMLPRGTVLRGGDVLRASDARIVEVVARPESVLHVECETPRALARAAYHLGNRHVPVEVCEGYLRLAADHVLEQMLKGLGATLTVMEAPFEPESGAYAAHSHSLMALHPPHRGRIHEYSKDREPT